MKRAKQDIITFKADASLLEAMKDIPNRSEFIRNAILAALDSACPLCSGTGVLSQHQKRHLDDFLADHSLQECQKCHDLRFVCSRTSESRSKRRDCFNPKKKEVSCSQSTQMEEPSR